MSIILSARNIYKTYNTTSGDVNALKGISYNFEENKSYAIIGRSGSGKSTFLHILGGLDKPTNGDILLKNENLYKKSDMQMAKFRRRHLGFVFQQYNLIEEYNVLNNIILPIKLDHREIDEDFLNLITDKLRIKDKLKKFPSELSGGEQQRVAICRAIIARPEIIIADEPTGNLDKKTESETIDLLTSCAKEFNQTLIIVTHNPEIAKQMDIVIKIDDGLLQTSE